MQIMLLYTIFSVILKIKGKNSNMTQCACCLYANKGVFFYKKIWFSLDLQNPVPNQCPQTFQINSKSAQTVIWHSILDI